MEYLENLSREVGNRPDLQREVALGYARVGEVQGDMGESNLGQLPQAVTNFEKAEAILARLVQRSPGDAGLETDYNRVANLLARSYQANGQFAKALALEQRNIAFAEAAVRSDPNHPRNLRALVSSLTALADSRTAQQQYAEAIPVRERILQLSERLAQLEPGNLESQRTLAVAHKKIGALYGVTKRYDESRREYEKAAAIDERRLAQNGNDKRAKLDLSYDYSDLGWVDGRLGKHEDSLKAYRRVLALRTEVAVADPLDQRAADSVASAVSRIGMALRNMGDLEGSERELRRSIGMYEGFAQRGGSGWELTRTLAMVHDNLADTLEEQCAKTHGGAACLARALAEVSKERTLLEGLQAKGRLPKADEQYIGEVRARETRLKGGAQ